MAIFESKTSLIGEGTETVVGASVKLKGNLKSEGNIKVAGKLNGEIKTKENVFIEKEATIDGKIVAKNVTISGTVNGNVDTTEKLEITESGKVFGDISTHILNIKSGGIFTGKSAMKTETLEEVKEEIEPEYELEEEKKE